ncbi:MAG: IclR family transcriptional regulator [Cellulomonas sp.]|nr:IclR family transcriptional regulator [Cellulomonas sp.]
MSNLSRAMSILEALADDPAGVRVTDLAEQMNVNRAIPHRLLTELCELGYVVQDPDSERYRATLKVGSLGLRELERANVMDWAQEGLARLAAQSQELARVSIASNSTLRFVAQAQGASGSLIVNSPLRAELALHATASGKAFLSTLPWDEVKEILGRRGMPGLTVETHTDLRFLQEDLAKVRADGFAIVEEEAEQGISAVAVAIVPPQSPLARAVGSVSVAGPNVRLTLPRLRDLAPTVAETADRLARTWHVFEYLRAVSEPPSRL